MKNELKTEKYNSGRICLCVLGIKVIIDVDVQFPIRNHCSRLDRADAQSGSSVLQQAGTAVRISDSTLARPTVLLMEGGATTVTFSSVEGFRPNEPSPFQLLSRPEVRTEMLTG